VLAFPFDIKSNENTKEYINNNKNIMMHKDVLLFVNFIHDLLKMIKIKDELKYHVRYC